MEEASDGFYAYSNHRHLVNKYFKMKFETVIKHKDFK